MSCNSFRAQKKEKKKEKEEKRREKKEKEEGEKKKGRTHIAAKIPGAAPPDPPFFLALG